MALIVETGSGASDAESFASVAYADTYYSNRGVTAWGTLATAAKEAALRLATDYMQAKFVLRWAGSRMTDTQSLEWPRDYVPRLVSLQGQLYWDNNVVPTDVQTACVILAYKSTSETLMSDVERVAIREKVGEIEVQYADASQVEKRYMEVEKLLSKFFDGSSSVVHAVVR